MAEPVSHAAPERPAPPADAGWDPGGEPGERAADEAAPEGDRADAAMADHRGVPPYRARVEYANGQWHLAVESLNDHPDRGEVDSVVVTVSGREPHGGRPPVEVDRKLRDCGFDRHGEWARHDEGWSTPCAQSDTRAAPAAPPVPSPDDEDHPRE
ncbi:hypothetical protein [Actinacidiphila acidipaludis]|uniref:Uncharacterized protein n=1 Tax=Actinacidiphila acidipaludis TaxID=2873382 RepID=A0ABS7QDV6_9ACTN|nr:hypothetical protein [Streptomyces acidipaludis]MBY8880864.1 hypothetical protein [Streptomyces acidipaludis]